MFRRGNLRQTILHVPARHYFAHFSARRNIPRDTTVDAVDENFATNYSHSKNLPSRSAPNKRDALENDLSTDRGHERRGSNDPGREHFLGLEQLIICRELGAKFTASPAQFAK